MNQLIDIITVTIIGIFLTASTASIILYNAKSFPGKEARTLNIWAFGLILQPLSWLVFSYRGNIPEPKLSIVANVLMIGGFALLTKATREFLGVCNKDRILIGTVILVGVAIGVFTIIWPNFSAMVIVNCCGSLVAFPLILSPLLRTMQSQNSSSQKILFTVILLGCISIIARMLDHIIAPRIGGNFLEPSLEDSIAVIYAAISPVLASFGFLLLHQERAHKQLQSMAETDSLTGILNRQAFEKKARIHFDNDTNNSICVLLIDIDHFKKINDSYGHETGDVVLKKCCELINKALRDQDIIGRMGGEEFMALLPNINQDGAEKISNRIISTVNQQKIIHNDISINLTVSIGLAMKRKEEKEFAQTLKNADIAMYEAKSLGRNQVHTAINIT